METATAIGIFSLVALIGFSGGSLLAVVAFRLLFAIALVLLINEIAKWCRANDTCASAVGTLFAFLKYTVRGVWSGVETGLSYAARATTAVLNSSACSGTYQGHGASGTQINVPQPDQCYLPCDEQAAPQPTEISSDGVYLELKYKVEWSDEQRLQADAKVDYLHDQALAGNLSVKHNPERDKSQTKRHRKECPPPAPKCQVDHKIDLQLGGQDLPSNFWYLDGSVNMSLGAQIHGCIKNTSEGTPVLGVYISGP